MWASLVLSSPTFGDYRLSGYSTARWRMRCRDGSSRRLRRGGEATFRPRGELDRCPHVGVNELAEVVHDVSPVMPTIASPHCEVVEHVVNRDLLPTKHGLPMRSPARVSIIVVNSTLPTTPPS